MAESYVLGNMNKEITRLEIQSAFFEPLTRRTILKAGIKEGMRCIDIGCGSGSVARLMAQMVGRKGSVIGVDIDKKYLQFCRNSGTPANTEFIYDDIYDSRLAGKGEEFDVVYSRFVFVHLKDAKRAIQSMKYLMKQGGIMIIEELDHAPGSWLCYPKNQIAEDLRKAYVTLIKRAGGDPLAGRKIYRLLVEQSLETNVECTCPCLLMGHEPYNSLGWRIAESLKPQIMKYGILSERDYAKLHRGLIQLSKDNKSFVTYARFFSIIGRKTT
jgi:ubiquinone/menaquinone biosynthesis C-methylase UbiE